MFLKKVSTNFVLMKILKKWANLVFLHIMYIIAYKSRNFGPNLISIFSIQLICGSEKMLAEFDLNLLKLQIKAFRSQNKVLKIFNFGHILDQKRSTHLKLGSTYIPVYTVSYYKVLKRLMSLKLRCLCLDCCLLNI